MKRKMEGLQFSRTFFFESSFLLSMTRFKIKDLPPFVFVNNEIILNVILIDEKNAPKQIDQSSIALNVTVRYDDANVHNVNLLEVVRNSNIMKDGKADIIVKFLNLSKQHGHRRFVISLDAFLLNERCIIVGDSNPVTVVQYMLSIAEEPKEKYIWYFT
jgi:hypothetical protein